MDEILSLLTRHGALLIFALTLAARIGAPVPAAPFVVVAGALAALGQVSLPAVLLAALVGNILGDGLWFWAGRRWGYAVLRLLCRISISADTCIARSEDILGKWGGMSLVAAKFVPGVSVVAPPMAGAMGMSNARFLAYESAGALVWTVGFLLLGWTFHTALADVLALLSDLSVAGGVLLVAGALAFGGWRLVERRRGAQAADVERIAPHALQRAMADGSVTVIDVRSAETRLLDGRSIDGALSVPMAQVESRAPLLMGGRELVVFCDCPQDVSAVRAARLLAAAGPTRVRVLDGGLEAWLAEAEARPSPASPAELCAGAHSA